jgi:hypothetical protein
LFVGFVGWPARSLGAKKKAAAASPEADAYGILNPGLELEKAAAVQDGGAPVWIGDGSHAREAVDPPQP